MEGQSELDLQLSELKTYVSEGALREWQPVIMASPRCEWGHLLFMSSEVWVTTDVTLARLCYICSFPSELVWGKSWKDGVCHCSRRSICLETLPALYQTCIGSEVNSHPSGLARARLSLGFKEDLQFWWMMQEQEWIYEWPKREWDAAPRLNIDDERGGK